MLDHAAEAVEMLGDGQRSDLETNRQLRWALTHLIEIVGEAANRVSQQTRTRVSSIPWKGIIGMRNRLIHGYDEVDLDVLWNVVSQDLPSLIQELEKVIDAGGVGGQ